MSAIRRSFLVCSFLLLQIGCSSAQDTLLLLNGHQLIADSIRLEGFDVAAFLKDRKKPKQINSYRVFSIRHADGQEEVVYQKDITDPLDFSEEEMRMFIAGEQDADRYYKNNFNKGLSFAVGFGSSLAAIYGLVIPPLYSTVVGSFTPNMDRMKVSDESLRSNQVFCEGYQSTVRRKKIKNSLLSGLAGFAAGFIFFNLVLD
ncbi:MAG: hypothetical protein ACKO1U_05785 [Bacteroidota bacterium]